MLLDDAQKVIFCRWLETTISSSEGIVSQMEKIGTPEALLKRERTEQMACKIVLRMLQSGESMTLG
jgi:hypothetical protein